MKFTLIKLSIAFFASQSPAFGHSIWLKKEINECKPSEQQFLGIACQTGSDQAKKTKLQMENKNVKLEKCFFRAGQSCIATDCANNYMLLVRIDEKHLRAAQKLGFYVAPAEDYRIFQEDSPSRCP